jgi:hypothetical protein
MFSHPLSAFWILISDIGLHIVAYVRGWIADYGYGYWGVPWLIFPLYFLALLLTLIAGDNSLPDKRTRTGLLFVFGLSFLATLTSLYVSYIVVVLISGFMGILIIFPCCSLVIGASLLNKANRIHMFQFTVGITILEVFLKLGCIGILCSLWNRILSARIMLPTRV